MEAAQFKAVLPPRYSLFTCRMLRAVPPYIFHLAHPVLVQGLPQLCALQTSRICPSICLSYQSRGCSQI